MDISNVVLFVLLGIGVLCLGVAGELSAPANRVMHLIAAFLGILVILFALLR